PEGVWGLAIRWHSGHGRGRRRLSGMKPRPRPVTVAALSRVLRREEPVQEIDIIIDFVRRVRSHSLRRRLLETGVYLAVGLLAWLAVVVLLGLWVPVGGISTLLLSLSAAGVTGWILWRVFVHTVVRTRNDKTLAR